MANDLTSAIFFLFSGKELVRSETVKTSKDVGGREEEKKEMMICGRKERVIGRRDIGS